MCADTLASRDKWITALESVMTLKSAEEDAP